MTAPSAPPRSWPLVGVLPAMLDGKTTGTTVREAQRHLATWTLQPTAAQFAAEASEKLGAAVSIQPGRKGGGRLQIAYNSLDELEGILDHIR